ncbi:MAG: NAD-dependent epimerase/dehydratase family protein [Thermomicrobiales bacterium]|nr:NAD-dependent epimerase/dehydratase family protein [Thermomicrobiales bacterium]
MSDDLSGLGTVLVTGGAGFIGSHLVDRLVAGGARPVVLDDLSGGDPGNLPAGVPLVCIDIANPASIDRIAEVGPDAIVHAAAQVSVPRSMAEPARDRAVNLIGTANVIEAARHSGGSRVVFVSTGGGIYGETDEPASEERLPAPKSFYSIHKYAAERYLELSELPHAIARLANVYGPRQRTDLEGGVVAILAERLVSGNPVTIYGTGEQSRDFVHVADVVSALVAMLQTPEHGLWNVGTGTSTTINELLAVAEEVFGPATEVEHLPARAGDVFSSCLAVGKIARDLGWRPEISLGEGLRTLRPVNAGADYPDFESGEEADLS